MAKIYAYLRYSSDRQSEGDSYERQTRLADAYALANGLTIHHWIRDEGVSAYKGANAKRGKLSKFIADVITGEIEPGSTLLVESVDRLSREAVMDALDTYTTIIKSGLTIVTLMDGLVHDRATYDREWPRLMLVVAKMAVAREESEKKSDRSKSQWKARREDQTAKRMVAFLPLWLEAIDKPKPERVALINRMFREIADLNFGVSKIASRFNDEGIPAWGVRKKSGKAPTWHGGSILNIVRGRSVLGEFQPMMDDDDGKPVPAGPLVADYYPEVVDPALYYRAQKALDGRQWKGGGGRKGESVSNLFSKLAKCAHCNGSLYRRGAGAGRFYLSCSGGMRKVCENRRSLRSLDHGHPDRSISRLAKAVWPEHSEGVWEEVVIYDGRFDTEEPFKGVSQAKFNKGLITVDNTRLFTDFRFKGPWFEIHVLQYDFGETYSVPTFGDADYCFGIQIIRGRDTTRYLDWARRTGTLLKMFGGH